MLAEIFHGAPWLHTSAAHVNGENLRLRTAQLLFNVFRRLLVLPALHRMGIGLAGPVLVPRSSFFRSPSTFTAGSIKV